MKKHLQSPIAKIFLGLFLTFFLANAYAITVSVESSASKITGLGFKVNGKKYGGLGTNYNKSSLPKGSYAFGLRLDGKDIGCFTSSGKRQIRLTQDTNATLNLNGRRCTVSVN